MSQSHTLRLLVNERLTAAAEEIFVLFERTIAEYEEELRRSKIENQRKQRLLDEVLNSRIGPGAEIRIISQSPGPRLNKAHLHKHDAEELNVKLEEEHLPVTVPESNAVSVKAEEASLLSQRHTDHGKETPVKDDCPEAKGDTENPSETDNEDDWETAFSCADAQINTEADNELHNHLQIQDISPAAQSSVQSLKNNFAPEIESTVGDGVMSGCDRGAERKKHQCFMCGKRFRYKQHLQMHIRVHTGEKPYSCPVCQKTFNQRSNLVRHERIHTGEKPYSCLLCNREFSQSFHLKTHMMRTHTK